MAAAAAAALANSGPSVSGFNSMLHHSLIQQKQNAMSSPFFLPAGQPFKSILCFITNDEVWIKEDFFRLVFF